MTSLAGESLSPTIWRCSLCGALVHPSRPTHDETPVAWCSRCARACEARRDGP